MSTAKPPNMSFKLHREVGQPDHHFSDRGGGQPPALFATTMGTAELMVADLAYRGADGRRP